jgi:hypothetical protein
MITRYTVIDEADELLQADWEDEFRRIMSGGGKSFLVHGAISPFLYWDFNVQVLT